MSWRPGVLAVATRTHPDAEHAPYVEWGTSDTEAQPHLRPAVARSRQHLPRRVVDEARKVRPPR